MINDRYLDLLIASINNELYIENDVRFLYIFTMLLSNGKIDGEILRNIRTKIPKLYQNIVEARKSGSPWWRARIKNNIGEYEIKNLRNYIEYTHSMIGRKRLENIKLCLDYVRENKIDGDFLEAGVWRGGASIFAKGYIEHYELDKKVYCADSFKGLPKPTNKNDINYDYSERNMPILSISKEEVELNFKKYNLLDNKVVFIEGWFEETLPKISNINLSVLRVDGDLYSSTKTVLENLYSKLNVGGIVIIDDYGDFPQCKLAVDEFINFTKIKCKIEKIDWSAIYWIKQHA